MSRLADYNYVQVIQEPSWIEAIPCCETANTYKVMESDETFQKKEKELAKVVEINQTTCILLCCKSFRGYQAQYKVDSQDFQAEIIAERDYKVCAFCPMTCNCFTCFDPCKPFLIIKAKGQVIGKVEWPFTNFFSKKKRGYQSCAELNIYDNEDQLIYKLSANCNQLPFITESICCFSMGCIQACERKEYSILNKENEVIGNITNIYNDILMECCSKADNFGIKFPEGSDEIQRILLVQTVVFLDYIHYRA